MSGLMKVIPFASVCYVIAGLASLGLPGLSGFVAEMTIFVGAFAKQGTFYTVLTIVACCSIVITAVYILRTIAFILQGPVKNEMHLNLKDATWYEKISVVGLILGIIALGIFPAFFANIINNV
jgi:NADH-quinone oxidoreductase subunit M